MSHPALSAAARFHLLRGLSLIVFGLFLLVGWFSYGSFIKAELAYAVPSLSFSAGPITLPVVHAASGLQPVTLRIPKINVETPIVRDVPVDDQSAYDTALESGVALARGSSPLEAADGNSFIFGHSSRFAIHSTPYDAIFALLPKLEAGDTVELDSGSQHATYTVRVSKVISANDVQYMGGTDGRYLTLVTCWPAGTSLKRWVVQAERTS